MKYCNKGYWQAVRPRSSNRRLQPLRVITLAFSIAFCAPALAAPQGLPFSDDFSDDSSLDATLTTAVHDGDKQAIQLVPRSSWNQPLRNRAFLPSFSETNSLAINNEVSLTTAGALGDLDHDGNLDAVFVHEQVGSSNFINRVCLGDGSGLMASSGSNCQGLGPIQPAPGEATSVRLADVNHDGHLDAVIARSRNLINPVNFDTNQLYLGIGDGSFAVPTDIGSDTDNTRDIQVLDVNSDGHLDVLVANFGVENRVYLGDGLGGFGSASNIGSETENSTSLETGDFDRDGDVDVIVNNGQVKRIYLNDGSGGFGATGTDLGHDSDSTSDLALADFTSDGIVDLLLINVSVANTLYPGNGTGGFSNPGMVTGLGTGGSNSSVGIADFDVDGHLDVVVANNNSNQMFFGDGSGGFVRRGATSNIDYVLQQTVDALIGDVDNDGSPDVLLPQSATPSPPFSGLPNHVYLNSPGIGFDPQGLGLLRSFEVDTTSLKLGDVDNDGDLDVVVGSYASDSDAVYSNIFNGDYNTNFVFGDAVLFEGPYPVPNSNTNTTTLDLGDADGDGYLDLVTGDIFDVVKFYRGNGDGNFISPVSFESGSAGQVIFGDVEPDGDLDILVAFANTSNKLYINDGTGGFPLMGTTIGAASEKSAGIALGDVDGDGLPDLVVANISQKDQYYPGDGAGGFASVGIDIGSGSGAAQALTLADFNGDGHLDVIVGNRNQADRIYLNDGSGGFPDVGIGLSGGNTYEMLVEDVNNDSIADIVAVLATNTILHLGDGNGGVAASIPFGSGHAAGNTGALGDLDRDGDLDLVKGINDDIDLIYFNEFDSGSFDDYRMQAIGSATNASRAGLIFDANGDHWPDLAVVIEGEANWLYLGAVGGTFSGAGTLIGLETEDSEALVQGDFDNDGNLDLAVANRATQNRVYFGDGNGGFDAVGTPVGTEFDDSYALAAVDVDQDGNLDLVVGNFARANRYYLGDGAGGFSATGIDIGTDTDNSRSIVVADVNHDGQPDLISGNYNAANRLYTGDGAGGFNAGVDIGSESDLTTSLALADLNNDGHLDLVAGNLNQPNRYYLGDGDGNFSASGVDLGPETDATYAIAIADIGNDGDADVVVANYNQANRLYLNNGYLDFGSVTFAGGADELATRGVAVGDPDRNGEQDIILLNDAQLDRQLRQTGYQAHRNTIVSDKVNGSETGITELRLTATVHGEHRNRYYLSNDGGLSWHPVESGVDFVFPTPGDDIRWKAELIGLNRVLPPSLLAVEITNDALSSPDEAIAITKSVLKSLKKLEKKKSIKNDSKSRKFARNARKHLESALKKFKAVEVNSGKGQIEKAIADMKKIRKSKSKVKKLINNLQEIF